MNDALIGQKRHAAGGGEVKTGNLQRRFACQDGSLGKRSLLPSCQSWPHL